MRGQSRVATIVFEAPCGHSIWPSARCWYEWAPSIKDQHNIVMYLLILSHCKPDAIKINSFRFVCVRYNPLPGQPTFPCDSSPGLPGCDAVQSYGRIPTCRRTLLYFTLKTDAATSSETASQPEDGGRKVPRNTDTPRHHHTASQPEDGGSKVLRKVCIPHVTTRRHNLKMEAARYSETPAPHNITTRWHSLKMEGVWYSETLVSYHMSQHGVTIHRTSTWILTAAKTKFRSNLKSTNVPFRSLHRYGHSTWEIRILCVYFCKPKNGEEGYIDSISPTHLKRQGQNVKQFLDQPSEHQFLRKASASCSESVR